MAPRSTFKRLSQGFLAWKAILLIVAILAPGPGYDTSALIASNPSHLRHTEVKCWSQLDRLSLKLLRWDALYFVKSAQRGYLFEQEWAFSWAYSLIIDTLVKLLPWNAPHALKCYVWAGIIVSNTCHFISVFVLYHLANVLLGHQQNSRIPFVASTLHIVSPAGIFLSSPYAESLFSALNFTGMLLYAQARASDQLGTKHTVREDFSILGAGVFFMLATWIRSNGLLSGLLFALDVVICLLRFLRVQLGTNDLRRLAITCASGVLLGVGSIIPQYMAYRHYCNSELGASTRPWCSKALPSIYTWVQSHYWNVGFLRYWTLSNLPLFLMAGPMLWLLVQTSIEHLRYSSQHLPKPSRTQIRSRDKNSGTLGTTSWNVPQLALPQLVLAFAAATNFHVQVINRLSSGYPTWYLAVAKWIVTPNTVQKERTSKNSQWICRGLIMYALVQGALFANFLPPA